MNVTRSNSIFFRSAYLIRWEFVISLGIFLGRWSHFDWAFDSSAFK